MLHTTLKRVTAILCSLLKKNVNSGRLKKMMYAAVFLLSINTLQAQQPALKPLSIGDTVPDITLTNVYNYPSSTIKLSDLKGKLVILDFWSTWCGSCIEAMPESEKLQNEFGNKIQIILVNVFPHDDINKVRPFFAKRKERTGDDLSLPYSLLQTEIAPYFPFRSIPHYVWIDNKGKIIASTSQNELTFINVTNALKGVVNGIRNKIDLLNFSADIPLLVNGNGGNDSDFLYRSLFTKYIEGIVPTENVVRNSSGKITRFCMFNYPPIMLLRAAYPDELNRPYNRILLECSNKKMFRHSGIYDSTYYQNLFCYDLMIPPSSLSEFRNYMKDDMKRYLGVKVTQCARKMNCIIITRKSAINPIATKGGKPEMDYAEKSIRKFMTNQPMRVLMDFLNSHSSVPLVDETGFSGNIDVELPADLFHLSPGSLKSFFRKNGFTVTEKERAIQVAVITNK
jgi:thiol-disulfide isomerase/thioredoxin